MSGKIHARAILATFGLNPYSNGTYSMRLVNNIVSIYLKCLNPYSNGIYSMSAMRADNKTEIQVS